MSPVPKLGFMFPTTEETAYLEKVLVVILFLKQTKTITAKRIMGNRLIGGNSGIVGDGVGFD